MIRIYLMKENIVWDTLGIKEEKRKRNFGKDIGRK
jgi:hypothetical protein